MSDDDRDIDMGSEDDDGVDTDDGFNEKTSQSSTSSTPTPPQTKPMTQAEKRAHHNMLERKRRDHIKDSFVSLRDSVPSLHGEKQSSRAQILKKAAEYIQFMRRKNSAHQHDIEDLKRQNQILENQIRALERAKLAGGLRAASASSAMGNPLGIKPEMKPRTAESDMDMDGTKSCSPTIVSVSSGGTVKRMKVVSVTNSTR